MKFILNPFTGDFDIVQTAKATDNFEIDATGSTPENPRSVGIVNLNPGNAAEFTIGDRLTGFSTKFDGAFVGQAYNEIQLLGNRRTFPEPYPIANGDGGAPCVSVIGTQNGTPVLRVAAPQNQATNIFECRRGGDLYAGIDSEGELYAQSANFEGAITMSPAMAIGGGDHGTLSGISIAAGFNAKAGNLSTSVGPNAEAGDIAIAHGYACTNTFANSAVIGLSIPGRRSNQTTFGTGLFGGVEYDLEVMGTTDFNTPRSLFHLRGTWSVPIDAERQSAVAVCAANVNGPCEGIRVTAGSTGTSATVQLLQGATISFFAAASKVHEFGLIPAGSEATTTIAIIGAQPNDFCEVTHNGAMNANITFDAHITAPDIATVRAINHGTVDQAVSSRTYKTLAKRVS